MLLLLYGLNLAYMLTIIIDVVRGFWNDLRMYGKIFEKMFEGSLYGKGWGPLLVMSYVIAHAVPDKEVGTQVELNPKAMADKFGESEEAVRKAIEFLCGPDPDSTSPEEGGRRLIKIGAFSYRVVNGAKYRAIRDEEDRRRQNREAQTRFREKKSILELLTPEQRAEFEKAFAAGYKRRKKNGEPYKADLMAIAHQIGCAQAVNDGLKEAMK